MSKSSIDQAHEKHWAAVAVLLRPQGRRGELLAEPLSDLRGLFSAGCSLWPAPATAAAPSKDAAPLTLQEVWFPTGRNAGRIVLKLSGCDSISAAEQLSNHQLFVPTSALPALEPGAFLVGDLIGCQLFNDEGPAKSETLAGTVTAVEFPTTADGRRLEDAAPLLAVQLPNAAADAEPTLIPFVHDWIVHVDIAAKRIVMHLPAGLIEADGSDEQPI